jgi:hypothetical protein
MGISDLRIGFTLSYMLQQSVRQLCSAPVRPGLSYELSQNMAEAYTRRLINTISTHFCSYEALPIDLSGSGRGQLLRESALLVQTLHRFQNKLTEPSSAFYARIELVVIRWMSELSGQYGLRMLCANYVVSAQQLEFLPLNQRAQIFAANFILNSHSFAFIALRESNAAPYLVHGHWPEELFTHTTGFLALWEYYPVLSASVVPGDLMVVSRSWDNGRAHHFSLYTGQDRFESLWQRDLVNFPIECLPLTFGDILVFYHKGTR